MSSLIRCAVIIVSCSVFSRSWYCSIRACSRRFSSLSAMFSLTTSSNSEATRSRNASTSRVA